MITRFTKSQNISSDGISAERKTIYGSFPTHWHDFAEIEFILDGSGEYVIDGKKYNIEKNMLFFMTPINFHRVKLNDSGADIVNIMFSENICNNNTLFTLTSGINENAVLFPEHDAKFIRCLLAELITAVKQKDRIYYTTLLDTLLLKTVKRSKNKSIPALTYVQSAMLYILNNFRADITLSDTAKYVGLSPAYLSSVFSKEAGVNFKEYLNVIRFNYAQKMLTYSDMSVSEVCYESGFDDYANFIRGFKARFGMPPGKFRKENKISEEFSIKPE